MKLEVVILAAGQGTRMKSSLPKVLHPVGGRPMLSHVIQAAQALEPAAIHVVIGHGAEAVHTALQDQNLNWVLQQEQLGTGHAVMQALPSIGDDSVVLILYGDVPLLQPKTMRGLVAQAEQAPALLTAMVDNPAGYGRVLRRENGDVVGVVEHKDADPDQLNLREVNTGVMAAPATLLKRYLPRVGRENSQGEYYLPDVLALAVMDELPVAAQQAESEIEVQGVNDRMQLAAVEREFQLRQAQSLLLDGVAIADPRRFDVRGNLVCGRDVYIDINVLIEGKVTLGDGVSIGPNCVLRNTSVGAGTSVHAMSHLEDAIIAEDASVGPFARLRPGTRLSAGARVGNFVETKNAEIGVGSKVNHLTYIGDCAMGEGVNIGAGTITCNYDGVNKHHTQIGDNVFVGSNSTLVAPIEIATGGFVAAGSTVTETIGENELALGRGRQRNIQGWQRPGSKSKGDC